MRIFLGRDGVSGDETATMYYWQDGKLISVLWGKESVIELPWIEYFRLNDEHSHYKETGDDLSLDRAKAIGKLLNNLKAQLEA